MIKIAVSSFIFALMVLVPTIQANEVSLTEAVKDYYANKSIETDPCRPSGSCFETACNTLSRFECDDMNEQQMIRNACKGVYGNGCLLESMNHLGKFEYDDVEEMARLVQSCRGVFDIQCISYSCTRMGRMQCDDLEEIEQVNRACSQYYQ